MKENALHQHPQDAKETVSGRLLETRDQFEEGNIYVYSCSNGKWEKLPASFAGAVVPSKHQTIFVRPTEHTSTKV